MRKWIGLAVVAIMVSWGPASAQTSQQALAAIQTDSSIRNFAKVSDVLYRGGQPTHDGFVALRQMGIKTVVDLRWEQNDRHLLKGLGFRYVHMPSFPGIWRENDVERFLRIVNDPQNQPVFVHCQHGSDRTGEMVAAYRIIEQGWKPPEATQEALSFHFGRSYSHVMDMLAEVDAQGMRQVIDGLSSPQVRTP